MSKASVVRNLTWGIPFVLVLAALLVVIASVSVGGSKQSRLCDKYVHELLTSSDLTEVTRAGAIVQHLDCGLTRRAPKP